MPLPDSYLARDLIITLGLQAKLFHLSLFGFLYLNQLFYTIFYSGFNFIPLLVFYLLWFIHLFYTLISM